MNPKSPAPVSRRRFIRATGAAAGTTLVASSLPHPANAAEPAPGPLPRRVLGRTRLEVTLLTLGAAPFGIADDVPIDEGVQIVNAALDAGVNSIDRTLDPTNGSLSTVVPRMMAASKFEVFTTNGVIGVRSSEGCRFELDADLSLKVVQGQVVLVHPLADGQVKAFVVNRGEQYFPRTRTVGAHLD